MTVAANSSERHRLETSVYAHFTRGSWLCGQRRVSSDGPRRRRRSPSKAGPARSVAPLVLPWERASCASTLHPEVPHYPAVAIDRAEVYVRRRTNRDAAVGAQAGGAGIFGLGCSRSQFAGG